jgi:predicted nuclease of predicted toxin-antitoxin system
VLFLLDNDVDAAVGRVVRTAGHRCITLAEVGLAAATDDEVSVWADDRGAVVLTHDKEYFRRRTKNTFGRHVRLACVDWDAVKLVERMLPDIIDLIGTREAVVLRVSQDGVMILPSKWE